MAEDILVIGIDPGVPQPKATAAWSVLTLSREGRIGLAGRSESTTKPGLAAFLREDPLLADERLRLAALAAPLTPVRIEKKPWRARLVEARLSRGVFAGSARGPQPPWISAGKSGWVRYQEGLALLDILRERGFSLFPMPPEGTAPELPARCCVEVYPKATLTVLVARSPLEERPMASEFMGQVDDWLFPQLFLPQSPTAHPPIEGLLKNLAPALHFAPETLEEAARIAGIRRPFPRREPLRAFVAALQGILGLAGGAALVGAEGDHEGYFLLPATWHPDWEEAWNDPRKQEPRVRRVRVVSSLPPLRQEQIGRDLVLSQLGKALASFREHIHAAFVYGSVAMGTDTARSDIDLMVISDDLNYADLYNGLQEAEATLRRPVHLSLKTAAEWKRKLAEGNPFVTKVEARPKIPLIGSTDDLA